MNAKNDRDESRMASGRLFNVRGPAMANYLLTKSSLRTRYLELPTVRCETQTGPVAGYMVKTLQAGECDNAKDTMQLFPQPTCQIWFAHPTMEQVTEGCSKHIKQPVFFSSTKTKTKTSSTKIN